MPLHAIFSHETAIPPESDSLENSQPRAATAINKNESARIEPKLAVSVPFPCRSDALAFDKNEARRRPGGLTSGGSARNRRVCRRNEAWRALPCGGRPSTLRRARGRRRRR